MPIVPSSGDRVASPRHRYTLLKLLNKGACANAFSVTDENGEKVFLKAYTSPTTLKPWYDDYLRYEIELNRRLGAEPVLAQQSVRATDVFSATFEHEGRPTRNPNVFQVFPFVSGNRNLGDLIDAGDGGRALSGPERLMVATIFLAALARLHEAKIVHADLKPENVQMVRLGSGKELLFRPLLVDLDFSVLADRRAPWHGDPSVGYVGTPGWFSPEHLRGDVPTTASDAFTASLILWKLLAGAHPFASALGDDAEPGDYRERVLAGRHDFGPDAPRLLPGVAAPDLARLLLRALSPDPARRPSVAELHAAAVAARRGGGGAAAGAPSAEPKATPPLVSRISSRVTSLSRLVLTGPNGVFSTGGRFAVTRATLRRVVGDDARYAGDAPQFLLERGDGDAWLALPPPTAPRNPTYRNGAPLASPAVLASGDVLSIGPVKAACTVSFA
ncbi:MAG: hypothetical protein IJV65_04875 [Kiritimatiellae bacterium]|nr:hypothetical protein [Kiritimatiellia bacterium]